jgi:hypothetical protein
MMSKRSIPERMVTKSETCRSISWMTTRSFKIEIRHVEGSGWHLGVSHLISSGNVNGVDKSSELDSKFYSFRVPFLA